MRQLKHNTRSFNVTARSLFSQYIHIYSQYKRCRVQLDQFRTHVYLLYKFFISYYYYLWSKSFNQCIHRNLCLLFFFFQKKRALKLCLLNNLVFLFSVKFDDYVVRLFSRFEIGNFCVYLRHIYFCQR